jgi:hypothetical protein
MLKVKHESMKVAKKSIKNRFKFGVTPTHQNPKLRIESGFYPNLKMSQSLMILSPESVELSPPFGYTSP